LSTHLRFTLWLEHAFVFCYVFCSGCWSRNSTVYFHFLIRTYENNTFVVYQFSLRLNV
jgi:hypothetical protein